MRTKLDAAKKKKICKILSFGGTRTVAARCVGCCVATIRKTAERDEEFAAKLAAAESKLEAMNLRRLNLAAQDTRYWRAAAWALERLYPDRYGARRPRTLTFDQVAQLLSQLADLLLDVTDDDDEAHERLFERIEDLTTKLRDPAANNGASS